MRVLITTDSAGGVWDHTLTLGAALRAHGHDAVLAHTGPAPRRRQRQEAERRGLTLRVGALPLEWEPNGLEATASCHRWLRRLADEHHADLIHCNSYNLVDPEQPRPQLLAAHSSLHGWWAAVHPDTPPPAEWEAYRQTVQNSIEAADAVVAPSHAMLDELVRHYGPVRGRVIHNGVSGPWGHHSDPTTREPWVLTGGRLWDRGKGHHILDAAAARSPWPVYATGPLRGGGNAVTFDNIRHLGHVPRPVLSTHQERCGLFVNPALYEPFGLGALEAAIRGSPLILTDLPSHRELWRGAARFVRRGDPDALADAIAALATDPDWHETLAEAAWHHARRYHHRPMSARYAAAYRDAAEHAEGQRPVPLAEVRP